MKQLNVVRLAVLACLLASSVAHAQYVWVDEKGSKQFSDLPPPPGTPAKNILKAPGWPRAGDSAGNAPMSPAAAGRSAATSAAASGINTGINTGASAGTTTAAGSAAPTAAPSLADREADYRKRTTAKAEQDKKLAEEARIKAHNAQACAVARATTATLATGERVTMTNKNGERIVVNDAQRRQQNAQAAQVLKGCK